MTEVRGSDPMRRRPEPTDGRNGRSGRDLVPRRPPRRRFELEQDAVGLRLRRGRRVCGSFSGIPNLSRNGD